MSAVKEQVLRMQGADLQELHAGSRVTFEVSLGNSSESMQVSGQLVRVADGVITLSDPSEWIRGAEKSVYFQGESGYELDAHTELSLVPGRATARALKAQEAGQSTQDDGGSVLARATFSARKLLKLVD